VIVPDLSHVKSSLLLRELNRRQSLMDRGMCPYCKHPIVNNSCMYRKNIEEYHPNLSSAFLGKIFIDGKLDGNK
jgi:hypothetical protein